MFWLWNELFGFPVNSCDYENIECNKSYVPILNWDNDNEFVWSLWDPIDWGVDASNVTFNSKDIQKRPASIKKVDEALEHLMDKIDQSKSSIQSFEFALDEDWETLKWTIVYIDDEWQRSEKEASINIKDIVEWWETLSLQDLTVDQLDADTANIDTATILTETVTTSTIWTADINIETVDSSTITSLTATEADIDDLDAVVSKVSESFTSNWSATFNWENTFNTDIDAKSDINVEWEANINTLNVEWVSTLNWELNANANAIFDQNVTVNWVSNLNTLNVAWYGTFADRTTFNEDVIMNDTLVANSNVDFNWHTDLNTLWVWWQATFDDDVDINYNLNVDWNLTAEGNARIDWTMTVAKNAEFQKNVDVEWKTTLNTLDVEDTATINISEVDTETVRDLTVTETLTLPDSALYQYQARSEKWQSNWYASLDIDWKVPTSELPDSVISWMHYKWTWEPSSSYPDDPVQWDFYKVIAEWTHWWVHFDVWDIIIYNWASWDRIPAWNTIVSVNDKTWIVVLDADDISDSSTTHKFVTAADKAAWNAKQDALGYTPEDEANKDINTLVNDSDHYPSSSLINTLLSQKEDSLWYTPEDVANKDANTLTDSISKYPSSHAVIDALLAKENVSNKDTATLTDSTTKYPSSHVVKDLLDTKQANLVSWQNIKTINNQSLLWSWNIDITVWLNFYYETTTQWATSYQLWHDPVSDSSILVFTDSWTVLFPTIDYTCVNWLITFTNLWSTEKALIWVISNV